jgi:serine phosphatase RsbU (regulator of sigma subunit)
MFESASYESRTLHLNNGDMLVVYSDGLTDAEDPDGKMFGEKRLLEIVRREAPMGSRALEQTLLQTIDDFTRGMPQSDDITFVVVEKYQ